MVVLIEVWDLDLSDIDEKWEGDWSLLEDEFLFCDLSSDRGEGDGQGCGGGSLQVEMELLILDEVGRVIFEKEWMKDCKFFWGQQCINLE